MSIYEAKLVRKRKEYIIVALGEDIKLYIVRPQKEQMDRAGKVENYPVLACLILHHPLFEVFFFQIILFGITFIGHCYPLIIACNRRIES